MMAMRLVSFSMTDSFRSGRGFVAPVVTAIITLSTIGCGSADTGVQRVEVEGIITVDGEPLPSASISFRPVGDGPSSGGAVKYGMFRIDDSRGPSPGTYTVTVTMTTPKPLGQPPGPPDPPTVHSKEVTVGESRTEFQLDFPSQ